MAIADSKGNVNITLKKCKGETFVIKCRNHNDYTNTTVKFKKNKKTETIVEKEGKYHFFNNGSLQLKDASATDEGKYRFSCPKWHDCPLKTPCKVVFQLSDDCEVITVSEGSNITFHPRIPTSSFMVWDKATTSGRIPLKLTEANLTITNVQKRDAGAYFYTDIDPSKSRKGYTFHLIVDQASPSTTTTTNMKEMSSPKHQPTTTVHPSTTATQLTPPTTLRPLLTTKQPTPKPTTMDTTTKHHLSMTTYSATESAVNVKGLSGCGKLEERWAIIWLIICAILLKL